MHNFNTPTFVGGGGGGVEKITLKFMDHWCIDCMLLGYGRK